MANNSEKDSSGLVYDPTLANKIIFFKKSAVIGGVVSVSLAIMSIILLATKEANFADDKHIVVNNVVAGSFLLAFTTSVFSGVNFARMKLTERTLAPLNDENPKTLLLKGT